VALALPDLDLMRMVQSADAIDRLVIVRAFNDVLAVNVPVGRQQSYPVWRQWLSSPRKCLQSNSIDRDGRFFDPPQTT
jgi:hypothetical protein